MTGTWAEFYLDMGMFLCGHFRAVGGCVLSSPVLNLSKNHHLPISIDVFYVFLCFQNLWIKNYSDGDWIMEEDLAKGINTKGYISVKVAMFDGICSYLQKC